MNINKDLVPEDVSKQLKEIGYDGDYWFVSNDYGVVHHIVSSSFDGDYVKHDKFDDRLQRPTYFQAFRWFREKYKKFSFIDKNAYGKYYYDIQGEIFFDEDYFKTYEEAEIACLRKLIEIVKGGNK